MATSTMSFKNSLFLAFICSCLLSSVSAFVPATNRFQVQSKVGPQLITIEKSLSSLSVDRTSTYDDFDNVVLETEVKVTPTLGERYSQLTADYYLAMAFLQSAVIAFGADVLTQTMEGANPIDFGHVFAIMGIASTASGSMNAFFLRKIENALPGKGTKNVAIKAFISTLFLGGAINASYIVGVPFLESTVFSGLHPLAAGLHLPPLENNALDVLFQGWDFSEFVTLTKVECLMFLPYHSLAFNFVPTQLRPLTQAGMAGTFNVIVSAVTLGYFSV